MAYIGNPAAPTLAQVSDNTITSAKIVDGAIGTADIADDAVTAAKISNTEDFVVNGLTVGKGAGSVATNTAVGVSALAANTTGLQQTAIGTSALQSTTSGSNNTGVGYIALRDNTTGIANAALGKYALVQNSTGSYNTALGTDALYSNTTASESTAVGYQALYSNTAAASTAFGAYALKNTTTGTYNTAVGTNAGFSNTTGVDNTIVGLNAFYTNTTGSYNTAIGKQALLSNTTASNNTAVGYRAGYSNSTGTKNTIVGNDAGYGLTTGGYNVCIGSDAGKQITTGSKNTILGGYNGNQGGLDIRTASNYIVLSDGDGNPRAWIGAGNNNDLFRVGTTSTATPQWMHQISYSQTSRFVLGVTNDVSGGYPNGININYPNSGDTSGTNHYIYCSSSTAGQRFSVKNDGGINNYSANNTNLSDRREKTNFAPAKPYLDTICAIPVQTFNYVDQDMEEDPGLTLGVVAQDVQAIAPELVTESNWGTKEEPKMRLSIYQTDLQYALMKAIQELKAIVDAQAAEIATLKGN